MKVIGLIGGMSWESSALYYKWLNEEVKLRLGGLHSCRSILYSVDFDDIAEKQKAGAWNALDKDMAHAATSLEKAGVDFLILCTNTMHKCVNAITDAVHIPLLHIADPTAEAIRNKKIRTVGLLGTRFTMVEDFYRKRLEENGINALIPNAADIETVHRIIYDELVKGIVTEESREQYRQIIGRLIDTGAEGIILGCTEITMLIKQDDVSVPVFDTTRLHTIKAVDIALT